ncbi:TIGR00304 family protein [Candidatus Methanoperedens nitroreducens]|uniref:TIGR00304 family protein n=1 Tax=Candidatus Methanoperedens nitratireducens TaxID=1392998 RepID=A0A062V4I2_9EURY|nr:TIGR00304 family protein [Candidatus Methanoperedens nitroreducens]KCZ72257.1 TIGR00304 family protein [Candidatus Methanoperedens nitroreducens]MDJ1421766.1 TIGR00304 family protein [Candidatus Methanoperedens sp.]
MPDLFLLIAAGIILIVLGFLLVAFGIVRSAQESERLEGRRYPEDEEKKESRIRGGGVILIGPVPIIFGSDKRFALIAMILAIVLMVLAIFFLR